MSVYPAGVKQARLEKITVADGKTSLIDNPCVVKSLSFAPFGEYTEAAVTVSLAFYVYDGDTIIMKFPFIGPNFLSTNIAFLFPSDGLRVGSSLSFEAEKLDGSVSDSSLSFANIRVAYQE